MFKRFLLLLSINLSMGGLVIGQVTTSSITGSIKDNNGQSLPGASVIATHTPSGSRYSAVAGREGTFSITNMRVGGPYTINVTYIGYEPQVYDEVFLKLAEALNLDVTVQAQNASLEQVVVTAGRRNSILNANRAGSTTNISSREIQRLPSISRSLNDFTRLTPQANGSSIGGGNFRQNFITVDGSDFNNTFGIGGNLPAGGNPISLDAVEEISVNVTPYDIRQSGFIGSSINSITRSGTNSFSGSVYTYFRNEKQQGNKAGNVTFPVQSLDFQQWGARVGGPLIKNKLFFFLSAETEKQIRPGQQRFASTAATGTGSFGSATNIARPTVAELDAISDYLRKTYNYETGAYQGYDFANDRTKYLARIDWNISDKHRMNIRYNQVEGKTPFFVSGSTGSTGNTFGSGAGRTDINALHFKNSNYFQENNFYSLAAEINSKFGKVNNTLRFSYNNQNEPRSSESTVFPFVDILKDGQPFTSFGYEPFTFGNLRDVSIYSVTDNVTFSAGKNNFTFGGQVDYTTTKNGFQPLGASYYRFNSFDDFKNGVKPTDFAFTYSLLPNFAQAFPSFKFAQYSAYAQDEIVVNSKFRLTLGLRADLTTYPSIAEVKTNPLVAGLTFAEGVKINTGELPKPAVMFSPRLGFNYDPYGNRSLQIRGGTGIFTGRVPFVWIVGQSGNSGMLQVTQSFNGTANTPGAFNSDPAAYRPATVPAAGTVIPTNVTAFSEDFKMPQTWKTSLAMDVRLPGGIVGTLEGILNKDVNTLYSQNVNLVNPTPLAISGYPDNRLFYPAANAQKFINPLTNVGRPSPTGTSQFNAIVSGNENRGYYFSVTTKLDKQFSNGLFASIAYIKSIASNLYDGGGDQPINTWNSVTHVNGPNFPELGFASFVVPDRVVGSLSYRKEFLKFLGTTVSLFYEGSIQDRFSYTYSRDFNRDGANNDLIYVPRNPSEITFVSQTIGTGASAVVYTPQQQSDLFFKFIEQDDYLKTRKGQYAERNGAKLPWRNQIDFKLLQDIFTNVGGKKNTIQASVDVFNFGNLLNSRWGTTQAVNASSILVPTNEALLTPGGTTRPTFRLATDRGNLVTESFRVNENLSSTYYLQFGLRYIFNN